MTFARAFERWTHTLEPGFDRDMLKRAFKAGWDARARQAQVRRRHPVKSRGFATCLLCKREDVYCWFTKRWGMRCSDCRRQMLLRGENQ